MEEIWKDVEGCNGFYKVSNLGNVKRVKKLHISHGKEHIIENEKMLTHSFTKDGYHLVRISMLGNSKKSVSRLVAQAFIPNPKKLPQVDHINRNKDDNRVSNLRWVDNKTNCNNKSCNRLLTYNGVTKSATDWADELGIKPTTILQRLYYGWSDEKTITTPVDISKRKKGVIRC